MAKNSSNENKKTLDKDLIVQALNAFKDFYGKETCIIPNHLYDQADQQGISLKGFIKRCRQKGKHGHGARKLAKDGLRKRRESLQTFHQKQEEENTNQKTNGSSIAFTGCIVDAKGQIDHATFLEQLRDLKIFAMRWEPYRRQLVKRQ